METDEYSNISELVGERKGKTSSSSSSFEFSRRHLKPSAFANVVAQNNNNTNNDDDDDLDYEDFGDDDLYEELSEEMPVMCSPKILSRENGAGKSSGWGGIGRDSADERFDSAKILEAKTNLRPTVTKVHESRNNNSTRGDNEMSSMESFAKGNRLRQNNTEVVKAQTPGTHEVGCGVESVRIANLKNRLRPVLSRNDSNDRQTDNNDKESVDGNHFNERSLPVATPSKTSKFNPPHHQSPVGSETSGVRPQATPTKASFAPKFTPFAKSSKYDDSQSGGASGAQPIVTSSNAGASAAAAAKSSSPLFAAQSASKASATRSASTAAAPAANAAVSGDGFANRFARKAASHGHGRSEDNNRFNNNLNTRQDNNSTLNSQRWYFGGIGREIAEEMLRKMFNETGSYVVRDCYSGGRDSPYALSVVHNRRIYHMIIRRRPDDKFSIGKPKPNEKVFNSVVEMITFHQNNSIELIDESNRGVISGRVTLTKCPPKDQAI